MFISFDSYLDSQVENIQSTLFASCGFIQIILRKREKSLWKINLNWIKSKTKNNWMNWKWTKKFVFERNELLKIVLVSRSNSELNTANPWISRSFLHSIPKFDSNNMKILIKTAKKNFIWIDLIPNRNRNR